MNVSATDNKKEGCRKGLQVKVKKVKKMMVMMVLDE